MTRSGMIQAAIASAVLASASAAVAAGKHGGHDIHSPIGQPGDAKKPARVVQVTMAERNGKMLFAPASVEVRKDEQIKFDLRNDGEIEHEFVLGTTEENLRHAASMSRNPDMQHDNPNAVRLDAKKTGNLVWKFGEAGHFEYACLMPGHREAGMVGTIVVK